VPVSSATLDLTADAAKYSATDVPPHGPTAEREYSGGSPCLKVVSEKRTPRRAWLLAQAGAILAVAATSSAQPAFVNGLVVAGSTLDATGGSGAAAGRFGQFSDLYYDPIRDEWWALSDRGPGGGLLEYHVRLHRISLRVHPVSGHISDFRIEETVLLDLPSRLDASSSSKWAGPRQPLNGRNPLLLNGSAAVLGRSFDPEGLVIDPRTGHFLVSDEYGPSIYEFDRRGVVVGAFETPAGLVPRPAGVLDYVAGRDPAASGMGRQDNRGFEGLAISPDGMRLFAMLQDPLINEGPRTDTTDLTANDGWDGRMVRIVVFDNDSRSPRYRQRVAQYVYLLEPQLAVRRRILAAGGSASEIFPRQGRDIGVCAMAALNSHEFLVLERDNRGIGVTNPAGRGNGAMPSLAVVGSKRVFRIDITGATDISAVPLPADGNLAPGGIRPVAKDDVQVFIDLAANTVLPGGNQVEKWESLTIGPRLRDGGYVIVAGSDNDFSVAQGIAGQPVDIYVDWQGNVAKCMLDSRSRCEINPAAADTVIDDPVPVPAGFTLLPGVLHAYRASPQDVVGYVTPSPSTCPPRHPCTQKSGAAARSARKPMKQVAPASYAARLKQLRETAGFAEEELATIARVGSRDSLRNGAIIGAVIGAAASGTLAATLCRAFQEKGGASCVPDTLRFAAIGGAIGAGAGLAIDAARTDRGVTVRLAISF
jgi:hypothetical protein